MILILSRDADEHTTRVIEHLEHKGAPYVYFRTSDFCRTDRITLSFGLDFDFEDALNIRGVRVRASDIKTIWFRRPDPPFASLDLSAGMQTFMIRECRHFIDGLWRTMSDRFWVNSPEAERLADWKPHQLAIARECGLSIPKTLIGNSPQEILEFISECGGEVVYKCFTNYGRDEENHTRFKMLYTRKLEPPDMDSIPRSAALAPGIYQEYVPKQYELRITVVGREIYPTALDSQSCDFSKHDWRIFEMDGNRNSFVIPHRAASVPESVAAGIRRLMDKLGLAFGCIDMIVRPDNEHVFLEVNPMGQWTWLEPLTGFPLLDRFCNLLMQGSS